MTTARRLATHELRDRDDLGYGFCPLCARAEGHNPDCPWLAMPKIVAALEAAQGLDEVLKAWPEGLDIYGIWSDWSEQAIRYSWPR